MCKWLANILYPLSLFGGYAKSFVVDLEQGNAYTNVSITYTASGLSAYWYERVGGELVRRTKTLGEGEADQDTIIVNFNHDVEVVGNMVVTLRNAKWIDFLVRYDTLPTWHYSWNR